MPNAEWKWAVWPALPGGASSKRRRAMSQMLLIPDPRPPAERLGRKFFRQAPKIQRLTFN
jgi:hypothetical protein